MFSSYQGPISSFVFISSPFKSAPARRGLGWKILLRLILLGLPKWSIKIPLKLKMSKILKHPFPKKRSFLIKYFLKLYFIFKYNNYFNI